MPLFGHPPESPLPVTSSDGTHHLFPSLPAFPALLKDSERKQSFGTFWSPLRALEVYLLCAGLAWVPIWHFSTCLLAHSRITVVGEMLPSKMLPFWYKHRFRIVTSVEGDLQYVTILGTRSQNRDIMFLQHYPRIIIRNYAANCNDGILSSIAALDIAILGLAHFFGHTLRAHLPGTC